jgi:hypothetical protein
MPLKGIEYSVKIIIIHNQAYVNVKRVYGLKNDEFQKALTSIVHVIIERRNILIISNRHLFSAFNKNPPLPGRIFVNLNLNQ